MLNVKTPPEVLDCISEHFRPVLSAETVPLCSACGRILAEDVSAREFVPGFTRSTVDGYAVHSSDTFGCSDSLPAMLPVAGEILMGQKALRPLAAGECMAVPTGGAVPEGADAVVMKEYTEDYGDGFIGIAKSAAPGMNLIYKGDDVFPGKPVLTRGRVLCPPDIGALAAMGFTSVPVVKKPRVGILSTGDELIEADKIPGDGQIRDVNSSLLAALCQDAGAEAVCYGIFPDKEDLIAAGLDKALRECDAVLLSGGSSVGEKDAACKIMASRGEILFHGIAMKPGKPAILSLIDGKGVWGLPGHPVAAYFVFRLFVKPMLRRMTGSEVTPRSVTAVLDETVNANHGREEYIAVRLAEKDGALHALPIRAKSGLITSLACSDGFIRVDRNLEGIASGAAVQVFINNID